MKDFLSNELTVGDDIVYCSRTGSSMNLVKAKVLEVSFNTVKAAPDAPERAYKKFFDKRTDKVTYVWSSTEHMAKDSCWKHRVTGEEISMQQKHERDMVRWRTPGHLQTSEMIEDRDGAWLYQSPVWKDYIEERKTPIRNVRLTKSYYIVKLNG